MRYRNIRFQFIAYRVTNIESEDTRYIRSTERRRRRNQTAVHELPYILWRTGDDRKAVGYRENRGEPLYARGQMPRVEHRAKRR